MVKYVLSLDGGGVRGIIILQFLMQLETELNKPIYETFDLFCGTSIGAFIAAAFAIKKYKCEDFYNVNDFFQIFDKSMGDQIFGPVQFKPMYDGIQKRNLLKKYFEDSKISDIDKDKVLVIPTYNLLTRKLKFFKSYKNVDYSCVDVIDSATAASCYFPTCKFQNPENGENMELIDAGISVNNPAVCAYVEAKKLWPDEEIKILSIGTGSNSKPITKAHNWGLLQWAPHLVNLLMDQSFVDYQLTELLNTNGIRYLRINDKIEFGASEKIDDTSKENFSGLIFMGKDWYKTYGKKVLKFLK